MSELKVDIIKSTNSGLPIVFGPELSVTDYSGTIEHFNASKTDGVKILSPLYLGTVNDNTPGVSGQILCSNGATSPATWKDIPFAYTNSVEKETIVPWLISYNGFSAGSPYSLPILPSNTDGTRKDAWIYCDGTNNTPDLRVTNPYTNVKSWMPISDADILAVLEIVGSYQNIKALYQTSPRNYRIFYSGVSATQTTWGAPTVGILKSITGPTVAGPGNPSTGVPLFTSAIVKIGGGTAGDTTETGSPIEPGNYIKGSPSDFNVGGYIKFKDATAGTVFTINSILPQQKVTISSPPDWGYIDFYTKSLAYIKKV